MGFLDYLTASLGLVEKKTPEKTRRPSVKSQKTSIDYTFKERKIAIQEPVNFTDIVHFVHTLKNNIPLIVNFSSLQKQHAERGLDFVCGAVCAMGGKLERIGDGIYFYAPKDFKVTK